MPFAISVAQLEISYLNERRPRAIWPQKNSEGSRRRHSDWQRRPISSSPPEISGLGFNFGHALLGTTEFEVIQFVFHFYGFETYNMLVNPNNRLIKKVLTRMMESGDYFFFAISPNQSVTAFRSEIGQKNLAGLSTNLRQIQGSTTTDAQYQRALAQFRRRPDPPGQVLNWVCRDNLSYLDLTQNRLEVDPD